MFHSLVPGQDLYCEILGAGTLKYKFIYRILHSGTSILDCAARCYCNTNKFKYISHWLVIFSLWIYVYSIYARTFMNTCHFACTKFWDCFWKWMMLNVGIHREVCWNFSYSGAVWSCLSFWIMFIFQTVSPFYFWRVPQLRWLVLLHWVSQSWWGVPIIEKMSVHDKKGKISCLLSFVTGCQDSSFKYLFKSSYPAKISL